MEQLQPVRFTTGNGFWWNGVVGDKIDHPGTYANSPLYPIQATEVVLVEGSPVLGYRTACFESEFQRLTT